jgi:transposase, IS30 family
VDRISDRERLRVAELVAEGAPAWKLRQEIHRSRYAIRRAVIALQRPAVKPPTRGPLRLSLVEREEISRGLVAGLSLRAIARQLDRSPSTISREVRSNGGASRYRAHRSDRRAVRLARRPKLAKLAINARLREVVEAKLALRWSPQQISGWLKLTYPDEPEMRVSHESIYLSLFVQSRGALRKELAGYLRIGRAHRRPAGLFSVPPATTWCMCETSASPARPTPWSSKRSRARHGPRQRRHRLRHPGFSRTADVGGIP